jgi:hypothetical protein
MVSRLALASTCSSFLVEVWSNLLPGLCVARRHASVASGELPRLRSAWVPLRQWRINATLSESWKLVGCYLQAAGRDAGPTGLSLTYGSHEQL